jgi:hypothetical protein
VDDTGALIPPKAIEAEEVKRHIPHVLMDAEAAVYSEDEQAVEVKDEPPAQPDLRDEDMQEIEELLQLKRTFRLKQENRPPEWLTEVTLGCQNMYGLHRRVTSN